MDRPWFDAKTGVLLFDEYVMRMPSFQTVMADGVVTSEEMDEQARRVADLLRKLEKMLPAKAHAVATDALCEMAVLYALHRRQ